MNVRNPGIANFGITVIQSRHSVRKFKDEPVPPETGDHTPLALFAVLGVVSAAVFALLSRRRGY